MAHFAELDKNNFVIRVIVVHDNELLDENGIEQEQKGIDFCKSLLGGNWVQTSYNGSFRKHYAGTGFYYSKEYDCFFPPKPLEYPSWVLDVAEAIWKPPIPEPNDGKVYRWDEPTKSWFKIGDGQITIDIT